jgi:transcriptional regulator with XRE-family HTH domain
VTANSAGTELKRRREAAQLSQQAFAERLGVSLPSVSGWERGKNIPRRQMAARIDKTLRAGGELLAAFGYVTPSGGLGELTDLVADLSRRVNSMQAQLEALTEGSQAKRRSAPRARRSQQGPV